MEEEIEQDLLKKIRFLTHVVLISGALNIALIATLISFAFHKSSEEEYGFNPSMKKVKVSISKANHQILSSYFSYSFSDLLEELRNVELVEDGYRRRDLALAYLSAFHYFDVEKALPGIAIQRRKMTFFHKEGGERLDLTVFPGLNDDHYQALLYYAHIEKWPFTTEGLFYELMRRKDAAPSSLIDSFYVTDEFHQIYNYLVHNGLVISREDLLHLILEGNFDLFREFAEKCKQNPAHLDLSREFLLSYIRLNSKIAADLLIKMDAEFALRKLADTDLALVIENLPEKEDRFEPFLKELIYSVRSDIVRKKAGLKLYLLAGEEPPAPYDHNETLKRFIPAMKKAQIQIQDPMLLYQQKQFLAESGLDKKTHYVQEGETLWKISRKYKVDLHLLMKVNQLDSEYSLPVGKKLLIP